jgi:arsenite methyltransferase
MEDLSAANVADASVDVVISNCVINLAPDKRRVFEEIIRVLKPGGEIYFSDVFVDRRLPTSLRDDPVLLGECLAGAMYVEDFRRLLRDLGIPDFRIVARHPIAIQDDNVVAKLGAARFESLTVRAFKIAELEDQCEDYGQVARYLGTIPGSPHRFALDDHHVFEASRPMLVCGNTAAMVSRTRLAKHFDVQGDTSAHFGLFDCSPTAASGSTASSGSDCC